MMINKEKAQNVEEMWETTGQGAIYVNVTGIDGKITTAYVGGRPKARLRITQYDRMLNQESCIEPIGDPFTNGMLVRIDADQQDDVSTASPNALTEEQTLAMFELKGADFNAKIDTLNEFTLRRMGVMAEDVDATNSQISALKAMIETKWPIGGPMPIYKELSALGQVASDSG